MRVIEVDPLVDERWERYVKRHPDGLVFHHAAWLRVLSGDYRGGLIAFMCEGADGDVAGVLPLVRVRGLPVGPSRRIGGPRLVSLPRTPIGGPLSSSPEATLALARAAVERATAEGLELVLKPGPRSAEELASVLSVTPGDTDYTLRLPPSEDELRFGGSRNHAAIRRAVNKAAKLGVEVRPADDERDLRAWYMLYLETMRRHVAPPRPYRFFHAMWEILRPDGMFELWLAEGRSGTSRHLLAGCVYLMSNETVVFGFNGRRERDLPARPNDALHWHAIHDAHRRGFRRYDFGEVEDGNAGLAQFKLKWGAEPRRVLRYVHPPVATTTERAPDGARRVRRAVGIAWQRMPLPVTAGVAGVLHRFV